MQKSRVIVSSAAEAAIGSKEAAQVGSGAARMVLEGIRRKLNSAIHEGEPS